MALYRCGQPGCRGHHTFSESCSTAAIPDYPVLTAFEKLLESQPLSPVSADTPAPVAAPVKTRAYSAYWRE